MWNFQKDSIGCTISLREVVVVRNISAYHHNVSVCVFKSYVVHFVCFRVDSNITSVDNNKVIRIDSFKVVQGIVSDISVIKYKRILSVCLKAFDVSSEYIPTFIL